MIKLVLSPFEAKIFTTFRNQIRFVLLNVTVSIDLYVETETEGRYLEDIVNICQSVQYSPEVIQDSGHHIWFALVAYLGELDHICKQHSHFFVHSSCEVQTITEKKQRN